MDGAKTVMGTPRWVWLVVALAVASDLWTFLDPANRYRIGLDFAVFRDAALRPVAELYSGGDRYNPFVNPPTARFLFLPLAYLGPVAAFIAWTTANVLVYFKGLSRLFPERWVALSLTSSIFIWAVWLGQATPLLTGIAALGCAASPLVGGVALGAILTVKPQLFWLAPLFFLVWREWRALLGIMVGSLTMVILALIAFGIGPWLSWIESLSSFRSLLLLHEVLQISPSLSAQAQSFGQGAAQAVLALSVVLALLAARNAGQDPAIRFGCIIASSAFAAPYSLPHDLVGILPLALLAVAHRRLTPRIVGGLLFLAQAPALMIAATLAAAVTAPGRAGWFRWGQPPQPATT